jgi:anti-sigma28 factor (negative regulator of flagellin synthesis)
MKIHPTVPATPVLGPAASPEARAAERTPEPAPAHRVLVSLSEDARWVASITEEIRNGPAIREDLVESVKAALAAGTYDGSVDIETVLENLLADL